MRLILRDFVGVVDFAVVDPAGVNVEGEAQHLAAHHRTFKMPTGRTLAPRAVPFHLARLYGRSLAPDREVGGVALALDALDPALSVLGHGAGQAPVIGHGGHIEIEPAVELVAMLVRDASRKFDHLRDVIGRHRPLRWLADIQRLHVRPIGLLVMFGDVPDRLRLLRRHLFHLVLARVGIVGQVAHVRDVDDVGECIPLPAQRPPQHIGEHIGAHIADMRVVIDRRPAGIDARLTGVDGGEGFELAGERVEQAQFVVWGSVGHGRVLWTATGTTSIPSSLRAEGAAIQSGARAALDCRVASLLAMTGFTQTR